MQHYYLMVSQIPLNKEEYIMKTEQQLNHNIQQSLLMEWFAKSTDFYI